MNRSAFTIFAESPNTDELAVAGYYITACRVIFDAYKIDWVLKFHAHDMGNVTLDGKATNALNVAARQGRENNFMLVENLF